MTTLPADEALKKAIARAIEEAKKTPEQVAAEELAREFIEAFRKAAAPKLVEVKR